MGSYGGPWAQHHVYLNGLIRQHFLQRHYTPVCSWSTTQSNKHAPWQESTSVINQSNFLGKKMVQLQNQMKRLGCRNLIGRCIVSFNMVLLTQFALSLIPRFFSNSSLLAQLSLSGLLSFLHVLFFFSVYKFVKFFMETWKGLSLFYVLMFYNSSSAAGGSGFWRMVQEASWHPCLSPSFCFLQYTIHLVFLCNYYKTRYHFVELFFCLNWKYLGLIYLCIV